MKRCEIMLTSNISYIHNRIFDVLSNLVPFVQFKKREKHPWGSATFRKVTTKSNNTSKSKTPPWVFSRFLNCENATKSRKASYINLGISTTNVPIIKKPVN